MDTAQASSFIGVQAAIEIESAHELTTVSKLFRAFGRWVRPVPDPAALVDVEIELHADFVAVRRGGADPFVLKKALLESLLLRAQAEELARAVAKIRAHGDFECILDKIRRSTGLFRLQDGRFMDFPSDKGISLWTKIGKTAASLVIVHPVAVAIIPALVFLAKAGSDLTSAPAPGFASPLALPVVVSVNTRQRPAAPVEMISAARRAAKGEESSREEQPTSIAPLAAAVDLPIPPNSDPPSIPSPGRTTPVSIPTQPAGTSDEIAFQSVPALNEQQRISQDNLFREQLANEAFRHQLDEADRAQRSLDSSRRANGQLQAAESARAFAETAAKAGQQMQRVTRQLEQNQRFQNWQRRQQSVLERVGRPSQLVPNATALNDQLSRQQMSQQDQLRQAAFIRPSAKTSEQLSRQQATLPDASGQAVFSQETIRLNRVTRQQMSVLNNPRAVGTPYVPPAAVTQPRTYLPPAASTYTPPPSGTQPRVDTPAMTTHSAPRTYTPTPTYTPPHIYTPPPIPHIPASPPTVR